MSQRGRRALAAAAIVAFAAVSARGTALADDWVVRQRFDLPLDGTPVDLGPFATAAATTGADSESPLRIVLRGTVSCAIDGTELDALARQTRAARDEAIGPFVRLPPGARLVASDRVAHAYTFEVPRSARIEVGLQIAPLAMQHLVTFTEIEQSLTGAIVLEVHERRAAPSAAGSIVRAAENASEGPWALLLLGPPLVGLGVLAAMRRRVRPHWRLHARARRALDAVGRESRALGPAFDEVRVASATLFDAAVDTRRHVEQLDGALARTARVSAPAARAEHESLREERVRALERLGAIADRLEETASRLAAHRAGRERTERVDALVSSLRGELDTAVRADEEASAV